MKKYKNTNGNSGIQLYEIGEDYIKVKFKKNTKTYTYSYSKAGKAHVDNMITHALNGSGLNGYINSYTKYLYD